MMNVKGNRAERSLVLIPEIHKNTFSRRGKWLD
jgi:hypothetical protein